MQNDTYRSSRSNAGFGFVEFIVNLVLFLVLATMVTRFVLAMETPEQRDLRKAREGVMLIKSALGAYSLDLGRPAPPSAEGGLTKLVEAGYFEHVPRDPWGNPYQYDAPAAHSGRGFDLYSLGPDGVVSGDDVVEWDLYGRVLRAAAPADQVMYE